MGGVTDPLYKKICSLRPVTKSRGCMCGGGCGWGNRSFV